MSIWFTSDLHIGHTNIIKYCNRPFADVIDMSRGLVDRWNSLVGVDDTVYVVGDVFLTTFYVGQHVINSMNGTKILIKGNHDRGVDAMIKAGFTEVHKQLEIELNDGQFKVLMNHYPLPIDKIPENVDVLIHGHTHGPPRVSNKKINVCVDIWDYFPVSEAQICDIINEYKNAGWPVDVQNNKRNEYAARD